MSILFLFGTNTIYAQPEFQEARAEYELGITESKQLHIYPNPANTELKYWLNNQEVSLQQM